MSDSFPSLGDIAGVAPRLVDRTRSQVALLRSLVALVPCVGRLLPDTEQDVPDVPATAETVSVLTVISDGSDVDDQEPSDPAADGADTASPAASGSSDEVPADGDVPTEQELPIQDYDGLAASQVVPRLATMSPEELQAVASYEAANRARRTILNRVTQLLKD